jgi:hypothetical protein
MKRRVQTLLAAGGALVLLVNMIVLAGVAWNRSGEPEATLRLSERELGLPSIWRERGENSGLALSLRWRVVPEPRDGEEENLYEHNAYSSVQWLNAERLAALGFDVRDRLDAGTSRRYRGSAREVWLALELDGPAHARSVLRAKDFIAKAKQKLAEHPDDREHQQRVLDAEQRLERVSNQWSRLIAIDADLDPEALRARHPDRQRIAIIHGRVRASWHYAHAQTTDKSEWRGHIEAVSIDSIHVPVAIRASFEPMLAERDAEHRNRYEVTVAYGRRKEPWIVEVNVDLP